MKGSLLEAIKTAVFPFSYEGAENTAVQMAHIQFSVRHSVWEEARKQGFADVFSHRSFI